MNIFKREDHEHLETRDLLFLLLEQQFLIIQKLDNLMTKQDFLDFVTGLKTEIGTISTKVDALEAKINSSPTDVDPDIVAAVQDLKGSVDALNTKADNPPAQPAPAPETPAAQG